MTICVAVKVNDCVVFAADSATSMTDASGHILNVFDHGNKVFNLYKELPIAAMTCGMGNIGKTTPTNAMNPWKNVMLLTMPD